MVIPISELLKSEVGKDVSAGMDLFATFLSGLTLFEVAQ
jgi:hypothetical protein